MISTTWTDAPAGMPAEVGCAEVSRRAPEAFTAPIQGTGLPFAGLAVDAVVGAGTPVPQRNATGITHTDATPIDSSTLGLHSSRRPPG
jgi:hypothetical protein